MNRRVLAYMVSSWSLPNGIYYAWIESPEGEHIFCQAPTLPALETLTYQVIDYHINRKGEMSHVDRA